jgi:CRP-like cAMP-binding protein
MIKSGTLTLFMESACGKRIKEREVGEGCIVGLPATINGDPFSLSCTVVEDAKLVFLSRQDVLEIVQNEPKAAMEILLLLSTGVQATRKQVAKYLRPLTRH